MLVETTASCSDAASPKPLDRSANASPSSLVRKGSGDLPSMDLVVNGDLQTSSLKLPLDNVKQGEFGDASPQADSAVGEDEATTTDAAEVSALAKSEPIVIAVAGPVQDLRDKDSCRDSGQGSPDSHKEEDDGSGPASTAPESNDIATESASMTIDDASVPGDTADLVSSDALDTSGIAAPADGGFGALDSLLGWSLTQDEAVQPGPSTSISTGSASSLGGPISHVGAPVAAISDKEELSMMRTRLEGRQTQVEDRLADARAKLARQQTLTTLWLAARTSNPAELWHVPETTVGSDELQVAARRLKGRTARLMQHRKRSRNGRAARHTAREVQRMVESAAAPMDPDATDSSSCESSESEAEVDPTRPAPPQRDRKKRRRVQAMWDADRSEVGWRWNWLDMRLRVIKDGIEEYKALEKQIAAEKVPVEHATASGGGERAPEISTVSNDDTASAAVDVAGTVDNSAETCARTRPLSSNFQKRHLVKDNVTVPVSSSIRPVSAPLVPSDRNAIRARSALLDRSFHVVLSLPFDAPHSVIGRARADRRKLRQQALQRQKQLMQQMGASSSGAAVDSHLYGSAVAGKGLSGQQSTASSRSRGNRSRKGSVSDAPRNETLEPPPGMRISVSVCPVDTPRRTSSGKANKSQPPSPNDAKRVNSDSSLLARRKKKETSLAIDDVMMPNLTPSRFEPLQVKEIVTPSWRCSGPDTPALMSAALREPSDAVFEKMVNDSETIPEEVTAEELLKMSDDAFVMRHEPCETQERQRSLGIVSETGQRSSVAAAKPARPRDHSKASGAVKIIENRASSVQPCASHDRRQFPLKGEDLKAVQAKLDNPEEVWPRVEDLAAANTTPVPNSPTAPVAAQPDEEKPIKLLFKLRPSQDAAP